MMPCLKNTQSRRIAIMEMKIKLPSADENESYCLICSFHHLIVASHIYETQSRTEVEYHWFYEDRFRSASLRRPPVSGHFIFFQSSTPICWPGVRDILEEDHVFVLGRRRVTR